MTEPTFTIAEIREAFTEWGGEQDSAPSGFILSQWWADFVVILAQVKRRELHYNLEQLQIAAKRRAFMDEALEADAETIEI